MNPVSDTCLSGTKLNHRSCWVEDMKPAAGWCDRLLGWVDTLSSFSMPGPPETSHSLLSFMIAMHAMLCSPLESCCFQPSLLSASYLCIISVHTGCIQFSYFTQLGYTMSTGRVFYVLGKKGPERGHDATVYK